MLGFVFLPLTTIVYAWELNSNMPTAARTANRAAKRFPTALYLRSKTRVIEL